MIENRTTPGVVYMVLFRACILSYTRCHELSLQANRVCTDQSSDSERARDQ